MLQIPDICQHWILLLNAVPHYLCKWHLWWLWYRFRHWFRHHVLLWLYHGWFIKLLSHVVRLLLNFFQFLLVLFDLVTDLFNLHLDIILLLQFSDGSRDLLEHLRTSGIQHRDNLLGNPPLLLNSLLHFLHILAGILHENLHLFLLFLYHHHQHLQSAIFFKFLVLLLFNLFSSVLPVFFVVKLHLFHVVLSLLNFFFDFFHLLSECDKIFVQILLELGKLGMLDILELHLSWNLVPALRAALAHTL